MPSSARRIAANRANAQKSTGPITPSGRARAALNAFKHGLATDRVILQGEEAAEFEHLRASMLEHYQPVGLEQTAMFDDMLSAFWRMRRAQRLEQALFGIVMTEQERTRRMWEAFDRKKEDRDEKKPKVDFDQGLNRAARAFQGESAVFQTLSQYEARLSRQYLRYRKELRVLQAQDQVQAPQTVGRIGNPQPVGPTGQAPAPVTSTQSGAKPQPPVPAAVHKHNKTNQIRVIGFVPPKTRDAVPTPPHPVVPHACK
jgi:hypothetical protein